MSHDFEGMQDFLTAVGRGEIEWASPFASYGRFVAGGPVTNHVIWPDGVYNLPPAFGVQLSIVSTSANDDGSPVGTGIRTMDIHYLDADLNPMIESVTLNGLTPVLTVATNIRFVQCMHLVTVGSLRAAGGDIIASSGGVTYSQISAGGRRCASTARMVPKGKRLFVAGAVGGATSGTAAAGVEIKLSTSYFDGHDLTSQNVCMPFGSISLQDTAVPYAFTIPAGPFPEGAVVLMEATTNKAATITGNWYGWLENA